METNQAKRIYKRIGSKENPLKVQLKRLGGALPHRATRTTISKPTIL